MLRLRYKYLQKDIFIYSDVEYVRQLRSNPAVHDNFFIPKKIAQVEQEYWFENVYAKNRDYKIWIAYDEVSALPIGFLHLKIDSIIHRRTEMNYVVESHLSHIAYYDRMIKFAVKMSREIEISMHKLFTYVRPNNLTRQTELHSNGFKIDGLITDFIFVNNKYENIYLMSKLVS